MKLFKTTAITGLVSLITLTGFTDSAEARRGVWGGNSNIAGFEFAIDESVPGVKDGSSGNCESGNDTIFFGDAPEDVYFTFFDSQREADFAGAGDAGPFLASSADFNLISANANTLEFEVCEIDIDNETIPANEPENDQDIDGDARIFYEYDISDVDTNGFDFDNLTLTDILDILEEVNPNDFNEFTSIVEYDFGLENDLEVVYGDLAKEDVIQFGLSFEPTPGTSEPSQFFGIVGLGVIGLGILGKRWINK